MSNIKYEKAECEVIEFNNTDVITTSGMGDDWWNNNGNGNTDHGNNKPHKPGNGGHKN